MKKITVCPAQPIAGRWTERVAQRATLTRLNKIANLWAEIAVLWGDIDMTLVGDADDEIREIEARAIELQQYWAERLGGVQ